MNISLIKCNLFTNFFLSMYVVAAAPLTSVLEEEAEGDEKIA